MPAEPNDSSSNRAPSLVRRHLLAGWIGLFIYLLLGIVLETLHGIKADAYVGPPNATRRLMWTLAHAHGTLFALINIAFAVSLHWFPARREQALRIASKGLLGGLVVLPSGFFLGGCWLYGGDPGAGVLLVPLGALLMLGGVGAVVWALRPDRTGMDRGDTTRSGSDQKPQRPGGEERGRAGRR